MSAALMFQGTGSDVGKSVLVSGLARAYARRGLRVLPFKPQNMSNNAAVTADGGEIGRAQALQALACNVEPRIDMNPVLLKPQTDVGAQLILHGRAIGNASAMDYHALKPKLLQAVRDSFDRLSVEADLVLVEGAGSPAETNLRANDIANMGFATATGTPVILIGDIDRGGVIASLVGTHSVLSDADRAMIRGFLINKFRGDVRLFEEGLRDIERRTAWRGMGVMPWLPATSRLPAEDAVVLERRGEARHGAFRIAAPMLSRISNFDDFDPLRAMPDVEFTFVPPGKPMPRNTDLIILPGTKATVADMHFIRTQGWDIDIKAHWRQGGAVFGICGGYQMLGTRILDPHGIEGEDRSTEGLGLLDIETTLQPEKHLGLVTGTDESGAAFTGYEIHNGRSKGPDTSRPGFTLEGRPHGARSADGRVAGCYVHGLFDKAGFRQSFLRSMDLAVTGSTDHLATVNAALDEIAEAMERHLDLDTMLRIAQEAP